jgi:hypothetical protein
VKTFVEFRSNKFPTYEGEQEKINPGLWGKRLAEYLVRKLPAHGLAGGEIILEDWGCYVPVEVDGAKLALCCGHQYGDDDEFLVFTDPQQPIVRKLFKKVDLTEPLTRLVNAVNEILTADPDIRAINWREP